ncbi:MAG TPA: hypothetical protein VGH90_14190 [Chthoniobacteraceae bacterium]
MFQGVLDGSFERGVIGFAFEERAAGMHVAHGSVATDDEGDRGPGGARLSVELPGVQRFPIAIDPDGEFQAEPLGLGLENRGLRSAVETR